MSDTPTALHLDPLEWVWRSLADWKRQLLTLRAATAGERVD
ncbi:MAG: hypothetical protein QOJ51_874 [Acidobacteriaceae bacterium]|jgi:uncharacterized membrane protein YeiB|nr:hypothetical protein [Acidobacteriaceae bacterium]MEA2258049.1 hypothetical protein [Acidobacteriaceae bacterium]